MSGGSRAAERAGTAFDLQPVLRDANVTLEPLTGDDFEALYRVASDPLIWEQHPSRDRYLRAVFESFFKGAMESGGAFRVHDTATGELVGGTRYYEHDATLSQICIGYTFIARSHWGRGYNRAMKDLMLNHAFRWVEHAIFHVGAGNMRSRQAMQKLGARLVGEVAVSYYGERSNQNVIYRIDKSEWHALRAAGGRVPAGNSQ